MASYKIEINKSAKKEIRKLPSKELRSKIISIITGLYSNPIPEDAKKIKGSSDIYRIRQGPYRIVYQLRKEKLIIMVIRVRHRRDVYRGL